MIREVKDQKAYNKLKKSHNYIFNINGIEFYNIKNKLFENVPCSFSNYQLKFIEFENPEKFHKVFDINNMRIVKLNIDKIYIENPDMKIVEKILNINGTKIKDLDIENSFEIEFEENKYYTILDFENGNYIAVNVKGEIFYLNHNSNISINKIFDNLNDFLINYRNNTVLFEDSLD